jgi:hypothetical protein
MMQLPDETGWNKSIAFHEREDAFAGMTVQKEGCSACTDTAEYALEGEWSNRLSGHFPAGFGTCPDCTFRARLALISRWRC